MGSVDKVALALSDPIRLHILELIAGGRTEVCCSPVNPDVPVGVCSCDLLPILDLTPSRLSYHMNQLKEAGLVSELRRGRWIYYSLIQETLTAFQRALQERFLDAASASAACCSPQLIQLD
jgi:ArsR family transcriptional regulator